MSKIIKSLAVILCVAVLLIPGIGCAKKAEAPAPAPATEIATVRSGNLAVTTAVDGNLVMPQAYNLLFGAPGSVQDVFVHEGDIVKEGAILATLDNTSQKLSVESSNNNVQTVLAKLYENVPLLPQFQQNKSGTVNWITIIPPPIDPDTNLPFTIPVYNPGIYSNNIPLFADYDYYVPINALDPVTLAPIIVWKYVNTMTLNPTFYTTPYYYPNAAALSAYNWAQYEVSRAHALYQSDNYTAAASELYIASSDLEACKQILDDAVNNPKSGLGNMAPLVPEDEAGIMMLQLQTDQSWTISYILKLRELVGSIKQGQTDIEALRGLMAEGKSEPTTQMFRAVLQQVGDIGRAVVQNINIIRAHNYSTVYGEDISLYFYNAAAEKLGAALKGIETGGLNSPELYSNLLIAEHYMRICNSILGSNDYVLQHGLSLKNEHQYNVDLQNALVKLGDAQDNFLKTVILAPFDGTVVSVGVKKNDVLSQIDYASTTAVQLVDTSQIKFQGKVDEIDIMNIEMGQKAMISVDAVPHRTFTGTVSFISPFGTPDTNGVVQFPVTILLDPTEVPLKGGLTATADIAVSSAENVLLVPRAAVSTTSQGSFVTVMDATGKQEKRQVTIGSEGLQFAEVKSGLNEGDNVVIVESATSAPVVKGPPRQSVTPGR